MTGQRMPPHWWREGWRLLAASVPHLLRGRRRAILIGVTVGSAAVLGGVGFLAWALTGGVVADNLPGVVVFALLGTAAASMACLFVYGRKDRPRSHVDGYIPESQEAPLREALRIGDLTGVPIDVRRYLVAQAVRTRSAAPPLIFPDLIFTGMSLLLLPVVLVTSEAVVTVIVVGLIALLRCGFALALLQALGGTTRILDAEARAVAREAADSSR